MTDQNPADVYAAPGANVEVDGANQTYQPQVFTFAGRVGRLRYLAYNIAWSYLPLIVAVIIVGVMGGINPAQVQSGQAPGGAAMAVIGLGYILAFVGTFVMARRRFNDLNKTGWLSLLFIIPGVNLIVALYLIFAAGDEGENKYGPAPCENSTGVKIFGYIMAGFMILGLIGIVAAVAIPAMMGTPPVQ